MLQVLSAAHAMVGDLSKPYRGATRVTDSAFFGLRFQAGGSPVGVVTENKPVRSVSDDRFVAAFASEEGRPIGYFACGHEQIDRSFRQILMGVLPYTI